VTSYKVTQS